MSLEIILSDFPAHMRFIGPVREHAERQQASPSFRHLLPTEASWKLHKHVLSAMAASHVEPPVCLGLTIENDALATAVCLLQKFLQLRPHLSVVPEQRQLQ